MSINRCGCVKVNASLNLLTEAVVLGQPPRLININRGERIRLPASVNDSAGRPRNNGGGQPARPPPNSFAKRLG